MRNEPIVITDDSAANNKINISSCGAISIMPDNNVHRIDSFLSAANSNMASNSVLFPNGVTPISGYNPADSNCIESRRSTLIGQDINSNPAD